MESAPPWATNAISPGQEVEIADTRATRSISTPLQSPIEVQTAHQLLMINCFVQDGEPLYNGYDLVRLLRSSYIDTVQTPEGIGVDDEMIPWSPLLDSDDHYRMRNRLPSRGAMRQVASIADDLLESGDYAEMLVDWVQQQVIGLGLARARPLYRPDEAYDITVWLIYHDMYDTVESPFLHQDQTPNQDDGRRERRELTSLGFRHTLPDEEDIHVSFSPITYEEEVAALEIYPDSEEGFDDVAAYHSDSSDDFRLRRLLRSFLPPHKNDNTSIPDANLASSQHFYTSTQAPLPTHGVDEDRDEAECLAKDRQTLSPTN